MINSDIRKLEVEIGELNQKLYDKKVELNSMRNKELDSYVGKFFKVNGQNIYGYVYRVTENGLLSCCTVNLNYEISFDEENFTLGEIDFDEEYRSNAVEEFDKIVSKFNEFMGEE